MPIKGTSLIRQPVRRNTFLHIPFLPLHFLFFLIRNGPNLLLIKEGEKYINHYMDSFILNNLHLCRPEIYLLLFIGLLLEGEAILFAAFYLVYQGKLGLGDTISVAIFGVLIGDTLWYFWGTLISKLPIIKKIVEKLPKDFDAFIRKRPNASIIASKFIYGFHRPTLIRLRELEITYRNFLKADIPGALLWVLIVSVLSYFFSNSATLLREYLKYWEIGLAVSLIIVFLITKLISKIILKKVVKKNLQ